MKFKCKCCGREINVPEQDNSSYNIYSTLCEDCASGRYVIIQGFCGWIDEYEDGWAGINDA